MNTLRAPSTNVVRYQQQTLPAGATTGTLVAHSITLLQARLSRLGNSPR